MIPVQQFNLVTILGPTATGKTSLAVRIAELLKTEIISADSRQIYIGMNLGTGKDLDLFDIDGKIIPYHLIDIISPLEDFSVFDFQRRFFQIFEAIQARGMLPILAGGTGLYLDSVLRGYKMLEVPIDSALRKQLEKSGRDQLIETLMNFKKDQHNHTDLLDRERTIRAIEIAKFHREHEEELNKPLPPIRSLTFGITIDRDTLRKNIRRRLMERVEKGMIAEVEGLIAKGIPYERLNYFGLEYRYVGMYLQRKMNLNEMLDELAIRIGQFAKRQEGWFRKMERDDVPIRWIPQGDFETVFRMLRTEGLV